MFFLKCDYKIRLCWGCLIFMPLLLTRNLPLRVFHIVKFVFLNNLKYKDAFINFTKAFGIFYLYKDV